MALSAALLSAALSLAPGPEGRPKAPRPLPQNSLLPAKPLPLLPSLPPRNGACDGDFETFLREEQTRAATFLESEQTRVARIFEWEHDRALRFERLGEHANYWVRPVAHTARARPTLCPAAATLARPLRRSTTATPFPLPLPLSAGGPADPQLWQHGLAGLVRLATPHHRPLPPPQDDDRPPPHPATTTPTLTTTPTPPPPSPPPPPPSLLPLPTCVFETLAAPPSPP